MKPQIRIRGIHPSAHHLQHRAFIHPVCELETEQRLTFVENHGGKVFWFGLGPFVSASEEELSRGELRGTRRSRTRGALSDQTDGAGESSGGGRRFLCWLNPRSSAAAQQIPLNELRLTSHSGALLPPPASARFAPLCLPSMGMPAPRWLVMQSNKVHTISPSLSPSLTHTVKVVAKKVCSQRGVCLRV